MNCAFSRISRCLAMGLAIVVLGLADGPARGATDTAPPVFPSRLEAFRARVIATYPYDPNSPMNSHRTQVLNGIEETERLFLAGDFESARAKLGQIRSMAGDPALRDEARELQVVFEAQVRDVVLGVFAKAEAALALLPAVCADPSEALVVAQTRISEALNDISAIRSTAYAGNRLAQLRDRVTSVLGLLRSIADVESLSAARQHGEALRRFNRIEANAAWQALLEPACLVALHARLRASVEAEIDVQCTEAARALEQADGPRAVQALSRDLQPFFAQYANVFAGEHQAQLDGLRQVVAMWLAVLTAEEAEDYKSALAALEGAKIGILSAALLEAKRTALMLRAMDAPRAPDPAIIAQVDEAMRKAGTVEDLLTLVPRLRALLKSSPGEDLAELRVLHEDIQALFSGDPNTARPPYPHRWRSRIARLTDEKLVRQIATVTLLDGLRFEQAEETAAALLLREADQAAGEGDWERLIALLSAYRQYIVPGIATPAWLEADLTGVRMFMAARRYEAAGADDDAMAAYRTVVQTIGPRVPHAEAAQRLVALGERQAD
jgi:hypothetical protein